jgi:hypothetical protein
MNTKDALRLAMEGAGVCDAYLADLSDADLLVRPAPDCNHIAWQLGHLIQSEHEMLDAVSPGSMPKLPAGFKEKHTKEKAKSDNPKDFLTKAEYVDLARQQRAGTQSVLEKLSERDLDRPAPESMRSYCPTVGSVFAMQGTHWLMHGGQWAVVRRKLGKPPLF